MVSLADSRGDACLIDDGLGADEVDAPGHDIIMDSACGVFCLAAKRAFERS